MSRDLGHVACAVHGAGSSLSADTGLMASCRLPNLCAPDRTHVVALCVHAVCLRPVWSCWQSCVCSVQLFCCVATGGKETAHRLAG